MGKRVRGNNMMNPEVFDKICEEIETTQLGVWKSCAKYHVGTSEFYNLINSDPKYQLRYARARSNQQDALVDSIRQLEDECQKEICACEDPKRMNAITTFYKLKIDDIKWEASKLKNKKYGDRLDLTTQGDKIVAPPSELTVRIVNAAN